jgi:hypothetical protein
VYEYLIHEGAGRAVGHVVPHFVLAGAYLVLRGVIAGPAPITDIGALTLAHSDAGILPRDRGLSAAPWIAPRRSAGVYFLWHSLHFVGALRDASFFTWSL